MNAAEINGMELLAAISAHIGREAKEESALSRSTTDPHWHKGAGLLRALEIINQEIVAALAAVRKERLQ